MDDLDIIESAPVGLSYNKFRAWHKERGFSGGLQAPNERWNLYKEKGKHEQERTAEKHDEEDDKGSTAVIGVDAVDSDGDKRSVDSGDSRTQKGSAPIIFEPQPARKNPEKAESADADGSKGSEPEGEDDKKSFFPERNEVLQVGLDTYTRMLRRVHGGIASWLEKSTAGEFTVTTQELDDLDTSGANVLRKYDTRGLLGRWVDEIAYAIGWCVIVLRFVNHKILRKQQEQEEEEQAQQDDYEPPKLVDLPRSGAS